MPSSENPTAGQDPVVLDIGGDVGVVIVTKPTAMAGIEVEIVPTRPDDRAADPDERNMDEQRDTAGRHDDGHRDMDGHHNSHGHPHTYTDLPPHVAVVTRTNPDGSLILSLVYPHLAEGTYARYVRPDGPVTLTADVFGGQVTRTTWHHADPS